MARTKLTEEQKAEKAERQKQENIQLNLDGSLKELRERFYPKDPTRSFKVGEEVKFGGFSKSVVVEKLDDGLIYKVEVDFTNRDGSFKEFRYASWMDLFKKIDVQPASLIEVELDDLNIQFLSQSINSLYSYLYYFGVDMEPEYQRGYVWSMDDKVNLIHSIFNKIDIGRFVLIRRPYETGDKLYEVLDGKQRLSALKDFIEDRFQYQGLFFSEMNYKDKHFFEDFGIVVGQVDSHRDNKISLRQKLRYFLKINTVGKVMDMKHLQKIREQLHNLKEE